ncbi:MAG TPA: tRNA (adenosine(37)-N6)-threonylcarbamoyltransferase complex dimerization subunit type 1 TsaB, partial [Thermoanaerobaculia bacterium]|nr:tRNA (adenosine(37)-N6)-threonylcarbamoyltransferase complex dimerization subunit type 1 TsaB [Thermoanaerobaculia bacterium]
MTATAPILALDTGSPLVSVAVGRDGEVAAERAIEIGRSSERLLAMVDEVLGEAGIDGVAALGGIVVLSGPGSFTGLRVGLATALGLHQASCVPATALPSLGVLAASIAAEADDEVRVAAIDVLRDEWAVQEFTAVADRHPPHALAAAERLPTATLLSRIVARPAAVVGFGVRALAERIEGGPPAGLRLVEPPPLAAVAVRLASLHPPRWDADSLTRPIYS